MSDFYELMEAKDVDYQNPLSVALRIYMKEKFLKALQNHPSPLANTLFEGGALVIYGTTLMTIAAAEGKEFPYAGQKSGDVDIYIEPPEGSKALRDDRRFSKNYKTIMRPFLLSIIRECGFQEHAYTGNGSHRSGLGFDKPFLVNKHFSPEEIRAALKGNAVGYTIPEKGIDVSMEIDLVSQLPLSPLSPRETPFFEKSANDIRIDDWRHLLAKKIARASNPNDTKPLFQHSNDPNGFKPRDLIDIYNIVNVYPPIVNLDAKSPDNDLALMRVLALVQFARYDASELRFNLTAYEPTKTNIERFRTALDRRLATSHEITDSLIMDMFAAYKGLIREIFSDIEYEKDNHQFKIILKPEEKRFLTELRGYAEIRKGQNQQVEPSVNVGLLKQAWPEVFEKHPELERRISNHPTLNKITERIANMRSLSGDF